MTLTELERLEAVHSKPQQMLNEGDMKAYYYAAKELESALPKAFPEMAKALREAWAALDRVSSDDRMSEAQITAAITEAQRERDEAMAEVQRLRVAIARFVAQYPWQDGPEIQELKALKEG